jgi:hypothetical protein
MLPEGIFALSPVVQDAQAVHTLGAVISIGDVDESSPGQLIYGWSGIVRVRPAVTPKRVSPREFTL